MAGLVAVVTDDGMAGIRKVAGVEHMKYRNCLLRHFSRHQKLHLREHGIWV